MEFNQKGLYLTNVDPDDHSCGVAKKIQMQLVALKKNRLDIELCFVPKAYKTAFAAKILSRIPFFPISNKWTSINMNGISYLYIRKPFFDIDFYNFIRNAKINNNIKILLEIPTYPYDKEVKNKFRYRLYLWKDMFYRNKISPYIDKVVTYSKDRNIFGIQTLNTINGIDFSKVHERNINQRMPNELHLICVANMSIWHGYDRLLRGLYLYLLDNKNPIVFIHFVGDGPETSRYNSITNELDLNKYVLFHGCLKEKELDNIYDICDIAICSLGCHRKNIFISSSLKSREYLAKGIPMVASCQIDVLNENSMDFVKYVPGDETPLNIKSIVNWYYELIQKYASEKILSSTIRKFGKCSCDIYRTMKPISEFFKS